MTTHVVDLYDSRSARKRRRQQKRMRRTMERQQREAETSTSDTEYPPREHGRGGERRKDNLYGLRDVRVPGVPTTAHAAATAYPYVAGPSLGPNGVFVGRGMHGEGAFCFDPWELYRRGLISGMSMMLFGQVGTGKSSLAKSLAMRLVLAGRKLSVPSDIKGEWTPVVARLGGATLRVAPGLNTRINPLDPGTRPTLSSDGSPMTDAVWESLVRQRRNQMLQTVALILSDRAHMNEYERAVIEEALDSAVKVAMDRPPTIKDVRAALRQARDSTGGELSAAAERLDLVFRRMETGDLAGMFDGPSTVSIDSALPAVSIDTSALKHASPTAARVVSACCGSWMESMVTNSDSGQRLVVYEEGWDAIASEPDLQRMVEGWKLARAYGLFNILILHKVSDLAMAGGQGSRMAAMAQSLLADADVKVIYRQDQAAMRVTNEEMELTSREQLLLKSLPKGRGLWRLANSTFDVTNDLTDAERPVLDTDQSMGFDEVSGDSTAAQRGWIDA